MKCSQKAGRSPCDLDIGHKPPCYAAGALPAELLQTPARPCKFCHRTVRDGITIKGNRSTFDLEWPNPNHWITCVRADAARRAYRPGRLQ